MLRYMDCTRLLDGSDKELGCVFLKWRAKNESIQSIKEYDNSKHSVVSGLDGSIKHKTRRFTCIQK